MATVTVKIEGLQQLGERFKKLSSEMKLKAARSATGAAAAVIKKQAVSNAPVYTKPHKYEDVLIQPGNLKKSIIAKRIPPGKTDLTSEHIVTVKAKKKDGYAARYGRLVEHGTVNMPAESYMRSAFDQEKGFAVQAMISKLQSGTDKASKS